MRLRLAHHSTKIIVGLTVLLILGLFAFTACTESDAGETSRITGVEFRDDNFARAEAAVPVRPSVEFPLRVALEEFNWRLDQINHPWYTYILGDQGNIIGYYVTTTRPINSCTFLSSTEDVVTKHEGTIVLTAPSLDGIFYGGSGASAGCDAWFFYDVTTLALIEIRGVKYFTSDQPLQVEAEAILVDLTSGPGEYDESEPLPPEPTPDE